MSDRSEPVIREARPGDESGIHEAHMRSIREVCIKDHGEDEVRGWGNRPLGDRWTKQITGGGLWVVDGSGTIYGVGYIQTHHNDDESEAHVFGLYLAPEVLRKGFGSKLVRLMLAKAKADGAKKVTLTATITAHAFYGRHGFKDSAPMTWSEIGGSRVRGFPMILHLE